jgi:hypothetical protein
MLDSGTVLDFNGIRKGTDVDVLFLSNVDKIILCMFKIIIQFIKSIFQIVIAYINIIIIIYPR